MEVYAHSRPGHPQTSWEPLPRHAGNVAEAAAWNADAFGWSKVGALLGTLHDLGKVSAEFQAYLADPAANPSCDHSTAGARIAEQHFGPLARLLAYAIAGHHAGLANAAPLEDRLKRKSIPAFDAWQRHVGTLPGLAALRPDRPPQRSPHDGFQPAFLTRMLFSCLVDADFIATEQFYAQAEGRTVARGRDLTLATLLDRLHRFQAARTADATPLNSLRTAIREHAVGKAALPPGAFTLTVPTGGGKTLTSLAFALEHAVRNELRRVIFVIPFTAIIEQTAETFRSALDAPDAILEHHASFDWENAGRRAPGADGEPPDLARMRRAAENWDAPIIVTTAVQFFESLYANRTSRCRKLHNLARAVIVLDEAQSLPARLLDPCLAVLDELQRNYGSTIVLCTATQPAVRRQEDGLRAGLALSPERELAPDPPALFAQLRRQRLEWRPDPVDDDTIAARFADREQMLCIVNSRRHAFDLFKRIRHLPGAVHLSTYMCPAHRLMLLETIKRRLLAHKPVRLAATSLVEAGVDFSFPEVWRAETGLDSAAQAAGRCNREGESLPTLGRVVVFRPAGQTPSADLALPAQIAAATAHRFEDPLTPEAIRFYFRELYSHRGDAFRDSATLDGQPYPILASLKSAGQEHRFDFEDIARAFRVIDNDEPAVIVPWSATSADTRAVDLLAEIEHRGPTRDALRALQRYAVPVPHRLYAEWLAHGVLRPVHPALGDALLRMHDASLYDAATGLRVFDPTRMNSADTQFS